MALYAVLVLLLAAPARAGVVEIVPLIGAPMAPVPAALALPQIAAPSLPILTHAPGLLAPVAITPALAITPVRPAPALLQAQKPAAARPVSDAREDAVALVRRLLADNSHRDEEIARTFDGTVLSPEESFADAPDAIGAELTTRNGVYTLADSRVSMKDDEVAAYERWTGLDGRTLWVLRRRSSDEWDVREWSGPVMPANFGPGGLPVPPSAYAEFSLNNGHLTSNIETAGADTGQPSTMINAKKLFAQALAYFGEGVKGINGLWSYGDNLREFNRLTGKNLSPEEAASKTWTGLRAAEAGFTRVVFKPADRKILKAGKPGAYKTVTVRFVKP